MKPVFDVSLHDFEHRVIEASHDGPIMVDFWADWCPPCKMLTPVLERVAKDGEVRLAKIEVDEDDNMKLAGRYLLRGFPTVILFRDGKELGRFSSAKPEHWVRQFLKEMLDNSIIS